MIITAPVYGDPTHLACRELLVRFKETKLQNLEHRVSDTIGAHLILINFSPMDSSYTVTYVNPDNIILKRLSYSRESVIEFSLLESVCRMVPPPLKPVLKAVQ